MRLLNIALSLSQSLSWVTQMKKWVLKCLYIKWEFTYSQRGIIYSGLILVYFDEIFHTISTHIQLMQDTHTYKNEDSSGLW